jgi:hypothetical protein
VVINGVWNLVIRRFDSKFIPSNNIYSSNKAYVGEILVVLDTIHSFRGEGLFLTRYIPMHALRACATIMLTKHSYIFTSIIIIALCLVKNPRNVLKKLHAVLGMMLKARITTSLERDYSEMIGL